MFSTKRGTYEDEGAYWARVLPAALAPDPVRRDVFNKLGFVAFALPPVENRRLSSQQGAFLFNGAERLTFRDSLFQMMKDYPGQWCRLFEIPASQRLEFERQLFQMNIHDLSLFPDIEGVAGFIRQKARLHWIPADIGTSW